MKTICIITCLTFFGCSVLKRGPMEGQNMIANTTAMSESIQEQLDMCKEGDVDRFLSSVKKHYGREKSKYWNLLGSCFYLMSRPDIAEIYFNMVIDSSLIKERDKVPSLNNLSLIQIEKGNIKVAIKHLKRSLFIKPKNIVGAIILSDIYIDNGLLNEALLTLKKSQIEERPLRNTWLTKIAYIHLIMGSYAKALRYYEQLDNASLYQEQVAVNYVMALKGAGRTKKARAVFEKLEKIDSIQEQKMSQLRLLVFNNS